MDPFGYLVILFSPPGDIMSIMSSRNIFYIDFYFAHYSMNGIFAQLEVAKTRKSPSM
ncbi:hypothetical protein CE91St64_32210 [Faecalicatena contorta]|nr:hypothetical protein CE91St64_32210 [Faecalicatena contorta]